LDKPRIILDQRITEIEQDNVEVQSYVFTGRESYRQYYYFGNNIIWGTIKEVQFYRRGKKSKQRVSTSKDKVYKTMSQAGIH